MFGETGVVHCTTGIVLKKAMWFETERVSAFPGLSLGPNPVLIVVLSITGYLHPERPFCCAVNVASV